MVWQRWGKNRQHLWTRWHVFKLNRNENKINRLRQTLAICLVFQGKLIKMFGLENDFGFSHTCPHPITSTAADYGSCFSPKMRDSSSSWVPSRLEHITSLKRSCLVQFLVHIWMSKELHKGGKSRWGRPLNPKNNYHRCALLSNFSISPAWLGRLNGKLSSLIGKKNNWESHLLFVYYFSADSRVSSAIM